MTHMFQQSHFPATRLIDARAWEFLDVCAADGIDARLVGGCVRDALLANQSNQSPPTQSSPLTHQDTSQPPPVDSQSSICATDIDIAIACPPLDIITFCKKHRLKCIPTGLAHGTLTILFKGLVLEVTSLRADIDTFGRHATVTFGASFSEDAHRRDFTMNALYCDAKGEITDFFGGIEDAENADQKHHRSNDFADKVPAVAADRGLRAVAEKFMVRVGCFLPVREISQPNEYCA